TASRGQENAEQPIKITLIVVLEFYLARFGAPTVNDPDFSGVAPTQLVLSRAYVRVHLASARSPLSTTERLCGQSDQFLSGSNGKIFIDYLPGQAPLQIH